MSRSPNESIELTSPNSDNQIEIKIDNEPSDREEKSSEPSQKIQIPERQRIKEEVVETIYGNDYNDPSPSRMGNTRTFWFYKGQPLIVIGPDCNFYFIIYYLLRLVFNWLIFRNNYSVFGNLFLLL